MFLLPLSRRKRYVKKFQNPFIQREVLIDKVLELEKQILLQADLSTVLHYTRTRIKAMSKLNNRLSKEDSIHNQDYLNNSNTCSNALKGEDLLNYIENNKNQEEENGDSLCIGAGYGESGEEGSTICRLDLFSTELIKAKKASHSSESSKRARNKILNCYSIDILKTIAEFGCISGKAHSHLQISDNERFFDDNMLEIKLSLEDQFGPNYLHESRKRSGDGDSHWKHRAVWKFIEMIASEEVANEQ